MSEPKRTGRPAKPAEQRRSDVIRLRTTAELAAKARRLGNREIERLISEAKEPT